MLLVLNASMKLEAVNIWWKLDVLFFDHPLWIDLIRSFPLKEVNIRSILKDPNHFDITPDSPVMAPGLWNCTCITIDYSKPSNGSTLSASAAPQNFYFFCGLEMRTLVHSVAYNRRKFLSQKFSLKFLLRLSWWAYQSCRAVAAARSASWLIRRHSRFVNRQQFIVTSREKNKIVRETVHRTQQHVQQHATIFPTSNQRITNDRTTSLRWPSFISGSYPGFHGVLRGFVLDLPTT